MKQSKSDAAPATVIEQARHTPLDKYLGRSLSNQQWNSQARKPALLFGRLATGSGIQASLEILLKHDIVNTGSGCDQNNR